MITVEGVTRTYGSFTAVDDAREGDGADRRSGVLRGYADRHERWQGDRVRE